MFLESLGPVVTTLKHIEIFREKKTNIRLLSEKQQATSCVAACQQQEAVQRPNTRASTQWPTYDDDGRRTEHMMGDRLVDRPHRLSPLVACVQVRWAFVVVHSQKKKNAMLFIAIFVSLHDANELSGIRKWIDAAAIYLPCTDADMRVLVCMHARTHLERTLRCKSSLIILLKTWFERIQS